ncbi:MAG: IclR family transcriptional regulator, partial [Actinomycetes bacterium]
FLEDKVPAEQWPVLAGRVQKVADELSVRLHGRPAK